MAKLIADKYFQYNFPLQHLRVLSMGYYLTDEHLLTLCYFSRNESISTDSCEKYENTFWYLLSILIKIYLL